jgi:hypothetical protein
MARGRKAIVVDKALFQNIIADYERRFAPKTRSALWQGIANTGWAKSLRLTAQTAMLKAKALNLVITTPVGKRGRTAGQGMPVNTGKRKSKRMPLELVDLLHKTFPKHTKKVKRMAKGSLKTVIAMKCLDCCCDSKKEVALCTIKACPNWFYRPYQRNKKVLAEPDPVEVNEDVESTSSGS